MKNSIPIKNVYYMLAYAFRFLDRRDIKKLAFEQFDNDLELLAKILFVCFVSQMKQGIGRDYIENTESVSTPHGKINLTKSIESMTIYKRQLVCSYDDFSIDSYMNRIIKTAALYLMKADISRERKIELRKIIAWLNDVKTIDFHLINWNMKYDRNKQNYHIMMNIAYLIFNGLLQSEADGKMKMSLFFDDQTMNKLYEKFILEYYRKEYKDELNARASYIEWDIDKDFDNSDMLPIMKSDVILKNKEAVLIIDAKYYSKNTQIWHGVRTIHSNNLYQIYAYVKNYDKMHSGQVSGMLLYAKTNETEQPDGKVYHMDGNKISVNVLDLNQDFIDIKRKLNGFAKEFFGLDKVNNERI